MALPGDVKSLAFDLGFHAVGIASAEPFVEAERVLRERYARGLLEGSGYEREDMHVYTNPRETLPTARSVIAVALSYLTDDMEEPATGAGPRGWMARFSRGLDYHRVLQERLFALADYIQIKLGRPTAIQMFADTGPLVDRSAAIRAGIGSRGKNTCVYAGEYKSWVILGELITDIKLEPDEPAPPDICGECNKCVEACPTGAICEPYAVDVRICLSHITQSKGFIPHRLREKMGTRIYGCDTCQSACPLNKDAKPGNIRGFRPSAGLGSNPELLPLLNISPEEFKAQVEPTSAGWIGRTRFRRNVAIALGNIGDPAAVPGLVEALSDPEPVVRGHSAWALGRIGASDARLALEKAIASETDEQVIGEIREALDRGASP
ncbi:MAG TPA: tRNA epoxyqueuosine(34) reductase QueG [Armatimonadota bacterium]|nr:tRNA epoxyqueuosine(34) reductase QueG [Armatimonadota bacterium]